MKARRSTVLATLCALGAAASLVGCGGNTRLLDFEGGVPAPPGLGNPEAPRVGDACAAAADCGERLSCEGNLVLFDRDVTFPEGYCTVVGCRDEADCGADADCVETGEASAPACLQTCEDDFDCRVGDGYDCVALNTTARAPRYCQPGR